MLDEVQLSFDKGFIVFTGETGAGKSLLVKALKLLLGEKGGANYLKPNCEQAEIEALFSIDNSLSKKLEEMGYNVEEEIHLKRIITSSKQRAFLNGSPVSLAELSTITKELISITSQHEHHSLLSKENQLKLLDEFLGLQEKVYAYQNLLNKYLSLKREWQELKEKIEEALLKKDFLNFQISEIEELKPDPKEEENLLKLREQLKHLTQLRELYSALKENLEKLYEDLSLTLNILQKLSKFESSLEARGKSLENLYYEIRELEREIQSLEVALPEDERDLDAIEARLSKYERLKKKYHRDTRGLLLYYEELKKELSLLETGEDQLKELSSTLENLEREVLELALNLSEERFKGKTKIERLLIQELHTLGMEKAIFEISLKRRESRASSLTPLGIDEIDFLFSPNPGMPLRPLEKVASGGELSRIFLAVRSLIKERRGLGTFIFDEVDTGIGGQTAIKVGEKLKELSKEFQIICITHLPQIARFADHHFVVEKVLGERETKTFFKKVEGKERLRELARMLGDSSNLELAEKFLE